MAQYYNRFMGVFNSVIDYKEERFDRLRLQLGDLGFRSTQKGSKIMVDVGCTVWPPNKNNFLRDCWSMGPVNYKYLHNEKAGY